jgi:hypothetical protein
MSIKYDFFEYEKTSYISILYQNDIDIDIINY